MDIKRMNSEQEARGNFAKGLNQREGFNTSDDIMHQWFNNLKPYILENQYVLLGLYVMIDTNT